VSKVIPIETVSSLLERGTQKLNCGKIETPALDARLILQCVMQIDHADIICDGGNPVPLPWVDKFDRYIARRLDHEPVHRIIGEREFWGLEIEISPLVLEPRPDTERLVELVLDWIDQHMNRQGDIRIADIGTGSGAIILALLSELDNACAVAVDISPTALDQAKNNAKNHKMGNRVEFIEGNWCEPLSGKFDLVISNPPYIKTTEISRLAPEVRKYDPVIALDGGVDGLAAYCQLLAQSAVYLKTPGAVFFEIGHEQAESVKSIAEEMGWENMNIGQDFAGNDRVFYASA